MTSVHSAKETDKWQWTEDETPAKTANPSLQSRMNIISTHNAKGQGMKNHWNSSVQNKDGRPKAESNIIVKPYGGSVWLTDGPGTPGSLEKKRH